MGDTNMTVTTAAVSGAGTCADTIAIDVPGLLHSWRNFFDNVEKLDNSSLYLFPTTYMHGIYYECAQIYHSTAGDALTKRNKAMEHFHSLKDGICESLDITPSGWAALLRFMKDNLPALFIVDRDEFNANSLACIETFNGYQQSVLVRNNKASKETATRDTSFDLTLIIQESLPTIINSFIQQDEDVKDHINKYKQSVGLNGEKATKNKLICRKDGKEGLLTIIRKKIIDNKFHITYPIMHCLIDENYPFKNAVTVETVEESEELAVYHNPRAGHLRRRSANMIEDAGVENFDIEAFGRGQALGFSQAQATGIEFTGIPVINNYNYIAGNGGNINVTNHQEGDGDRAAGRLLPLNNNATGDRGDGDGSPGFKRRVLQGLSTIQQNQVNHHEEVIRLTTPGPGQNASTATPAPASFYGNGTRTASDVPTSPVQQPQFGRTADTNPTTETSANRTTGTSPPTTNPTANANPAAGVSSVGSGMYLKMLLTNKYIPSLEGKSGMSIKKLISECRAVMKSSSQEDGMVQLMSLLPKDLLEIYRVAEAVEKDPTALDYATVELSISDLSKGIFGPISQANHLVRVIHHDYEEDLFSLVWLDENELNESFEYDNAESLNSVACSFGLQYNIPGIELKYRDEDGEDKSVFVYVSAHDGDNAKDVVNPSLKEILGQSSMPLLSASFPGPTHCQGELEYCYLTSRVLGKLVQVESLSKLSFDNVHFGMGPTDALSSFSGELTLDSCRFNVDRLLCNRSVPLKKLKIANQLARGILSALKHAVDNGTLEEFCLEAPSPGAFSLDDLGDVIDLARLLGAASKKGAVGWYKDSDSDSGFLLGRYSMANGPGKDPTLGVVTTWSHQLIQSAAEALLKDGRVLQDDVNEKEIREQINVLAVSSAFGNTYEEVAKNKENNASTQANDSTTDSVRLKCQGFKKNKEPCPNWPIKGSQYCRHHG